MGRRRKIAKHLPRGMQEKHGAYYLLVREDGRQKWVPLGKDFGVALHAYADLVGERTKGVALVSDAISHYLAVRAKDLKADTLSGYQQSARRLLPVFGKMRLEEIKREHVYRYVVEMGNVAANRDRALLSAIYTHMLNAGLHKGVNPCVGMNFRNPERPRKRYIEDSELATLVAKLPRTLSLMARWSYLTGMRESDTLALQLTAANEEGVSYVPSKHRKGYEPPPTLIEWTDELREIWRAAAGDRIGAQAVFPNRKREHYSRDSFQSTWQRWRKKVGIPNLTWHDIRRKTGSDSDTDMEAADRLGHADSRVTRRHYRAKARVIKPLR